MTDIPKDIMDSTKKEDDSIGPVGSRGYVEGDRVEKILNKIIDKFPINSEIDPSQTNDEESIKDELDQTTQSNKEIVQQIPVFIPRVEVHEIVKEVPKIDIEWIEKCVEVPQIQYVDKIEEVPQIQYIPRQVPKIEIVEVPKEIVKYVPRIETKNVQQIVEVPSGEKINVPQLYPVPTEFIVPKFIDKRVPVILAQTITPEITETSDIVEVEVNRYVPEIVYVDVYVPKPVNIPIKDTGIVNQKENQVNVEQALLEKMTIDLNPHLQQLENYNRNQTENFQKLIQESNEVAARYGFTPPIPKTLDMTRLSNGESTMKSNKSNSLNSFKKLERQSNPSIQGYRYKKLDPIQT